jgi:hypothetical protein
MGIKANNIVVKGIVVEPVKPRIVEESLATIREKVESAPPPKAEKYQSEEKLITYKESAFMADMLQSNKD